LTDDIFANEPLNLSQVW